MLIFLIASFATLLNAEDLSYPCEVIIPRSITGFFNTEIQVNTTYLPSGDVFIEKLTGNGDLFTLGKMPGINFIKFTLPIQRHRLIQHSDNLRKKYHFL